MPEIRKDITIGKGIDEVFAYLVDLENLSDRLPTIKEVSYEMDRPLTLGDQFHTVAQAKGRRFEITYEVSRFEPNMVFATRTVSGTQPFEEIFELETVEGGTKVTLSANGEMPGLMKLLSGRFKKLLKKQVGNDLERLKALLETDE